MTDDEYQTLLDLMEQLEETVSVLLPLWLEVDGEPPDIARHLDEVTHVTDKYVQVEGDKRYCGRHTPVWIPRDFLFSADAREYYREQASGRKQEAECNGLQKKELP